MPITGLESLCFPNGLPTKLCATFPGGAEICSVWNQARIPDPSELVNSFLMQLSPALAALAPIFTILEVIIAIIDCLKAVQKAIASFPPRPDMLAKCFPKLARALAKLLKMIPQLSIPILVGQILDAIVVFLAGLRNQLLRIIKKTLRIALGRQRAISLENLALAAVLDCAQSDLDAFTANQGKNSAGIGDILQIISGFLQLAGLDPLPSVTALGNDASKALAPLDITIKALSSARLAFPPS